MFFLNSSSKLATTWFGDKERGLATALGSLALPIGCIFGFAIPAIMITDDLADDKLKGKTKFAEYLILQNILTSVCTVPTLLIAREKPPTPPSSAASRPPQDVKFRENLKLLKSNKSYLLLCVSFTMLYGVYTSLGAVVAAITGPFGYKPQDNAVFGMVFIFFGVAGSFFLGIVLDKTQKFKLMINCTALCAVGFIILGLVTLPSGKVWLFSINLAFIGFSVIPIIPISYGFAVELTFPIPEAVSNGMMILPTQIFGAILGFVAGIICSSTENLPEPQNQWGPKFTIILFAVSALIGAVCSLFIVEDLRRLRPQLPEVQVMVTQDSDILEEKRNYLPKSNDN